MFKASVFCLLFVCFLHAFSHGDQQHRTNYTFAENLGQWNNKVNFKAEFPGITIFYEDNSIHYQFEEEFNNHPQPTPQDQIVKGHVYKAVFLNANQNPEIIKNESSPEYANYFIGNDPSKWASYVRKYQSIQYQDLYNGIDMIHYRKEGALKYDFIIQPNVNPNQIKIEYKGADNIEIKDGKLLVTHSLGNTQEEKPYAYQVVAEKEVLVQCEYSIQNGVVSFNFPEGYDENKALIIDPELIFSTYSGSISNNFGMTATYDFEGNGYMGGIVSGNNYIATVGAYQTTYGNGQWDISIAKFASEGNDLLFATFLGGRDVETVHSMVVDDSNRLYILGVSSSTDYPTSANGYDKLKNSTSAPAISSDIGARFSGGVDIVVSKLSADGGNLIGSTYFGGTGIDGINFNSLGYRDLNFNYGDSHRGEIVIDSSGFCYIGTVTTSSDLDTTLGKFKGEQDGIIVKFGTDLDTVIWSKYLGGSERDAIYSLKVINNNKILIGGGTTSFNDFPTTSNSYLSTAQRGRADGFISLLSNDGKTIEKSTFIGTGNYDQVYFIEFDRFNGVYAYGQTASSNFPLKNSPKANAGSGQFIVKLDENLDSLIYSTTFGSSAGVINVSPTAFLVDRCQNVYASGWGGSLTSVNDGIKTLPSAGMPLANTTGALSTTDNNDFYLYVLNRDIDSVLHASFFGGNSSEDHIDGGTSRFDKNGIIYQSVCASCQGANRDFPTKNAYSDTDNSSNSGCNNALFKLDFEILINADFEVSESEFCLSNTFTDSVIITNNSLRSDITTWDFNGDTVVSNFMDTTIFITDPGIYTIRQIVLDTICAIGDFKDLIITARPDNIDLNIITDNTVCYSDTANIVASSAGFANEFIWSQNRDLSNPFPSTDSIFRPQLSLGLNKYYVFASNPTTNACEKLDSVEITYTRVELTAAISEDTICEGSSVSLNATLFNVDQFNWDFGNETVSSTATDTIVAYPKPGLYSIQIEYENLQCGDKDTVDLSLFVQENDLGFENLIDTLFCGTGTFIATKNTFGTAEHFVWSSSRLLSDTLNPSLTDSTFTINSTDSSIYYLEISNEGCKELDSLVVEYVELQLSLDALPDSSCTPFNEEVNTTIIGTDFFQINYGDGNFTQTDSTPIVNLDQEGVYTVQLIGVNNKCNFNDTLSETVSIFQDVSIEPLLDTLICNGDTISINGDSKGTAKSFFWDVSPNFTNPLNNPTDSSIRINPLQTTIYYLKGENAICEDVESITVSTEQLEIDVEDLRSICLDDTLVLEAQIITSSSAVNYIWAPNDSIISGQGTNTIQISPKTDNTFTLISTSLIGCEDFDTVMVEVNPPAFTTAEIFATRDSIFKGETTQLSTDRNGGNLVYNWEPINGFNNPQLPTPTLKVDESREYKVTILDLNTGCEVVAFKRLFIFEVNCNEPDIFIPSAFTPNADLSNDILYVRGANLLEIEFQLFNRWGELVFETSNKNIGWDGTYKGKEVDPGVFVYQLKAVCFDGQEYFSKGNITVIR